MKRMLLLVGLGIFLAVTASVRAAATELYVDNVRPCPPPCFTTITAAVRAAAPGDVIRINPGVYPEAVTLPVGKNNLRLEANLPGTLPVISAPAGSSHAVKIEADGVIIRGLLLEADGYVVRMERSDVKDNALIENCLITGLPSSGGPAAGIFADGAVGLRVQQNLIRNIAGPGVALNLSSSATIQGNTILNCETGIALGAGTWANLVQQNVVRASLTDGISLSGDCWSNRVEGNTVTHSGQHGINVVSTGSGGNRLLWNTVAASGSCDLQDTASSPLNQWTANRFFRNCGMAFN